MSNPTITLYKQHVQIYGLDIDPVKSTLDPTRAAVQVASGKPYYYGHEHQLVVPGVSGNSSVLLSLHMFEDDWSRFTGFFREHFMSSTWKVAHLKLDADKDELTRVLVYSHFVHEEPNEATSDVPRRYDALSKILGMTPFLIDVANKVHSDKESSVILQRNKKTGEYAIQYLNHSSGDAYKSSFLEMKRIQGLFSAFEYNYLKYFDSATYEEVSLKVNKYAETMLIRKDEKDIFTKIGITVTPQNQKVQK